MPSASEITAEAVITGFLRIIRQPNTMSCHQPAIHAHRRSSRQRSFTCVAPPNSRLASRNASFRE